MQWHIYGEICNKADHPSRLMEFGAKLISFLEHPSSDLWPSEAFQIRPTAIKIHLQFTHHLTKKHTNNEWLTSEGLIETRSLRLNRYTFTVPHQFNPNRATAQINLGNQLLRTQQQTKLTNGNANAKITRLGINICCLERHFKLRKIPQELGSY